MSIIRADSIKNRSGAGAPDFPNGITVTGVVTATVLDSSVPFLNAGSNIQLGAAGVATAISFKGNGDFVELDVDGHTNLDNVSVAGVSTFGAITATSFGAVSGTTGTFSGNVSVGGVLTYEDVTNVDSIGIVTARAGVITPYVDVDDYLDVGSVIKLGAAGIITATSFHGSGANLTGLSADKIIEGNSYAEILDTGSNGIFRFLPEGTEKFRITTDGKVGIGTDNPARALQINFGTEGSTNSRVLRLASADNTERYDFSLENSNSLTIQNGSDDTNIIRLHNSGYVSKPNNVCFMVKAGSNQGYGNGGIFIPASPVTTGVCHNDGSHFNTSNGVFTAPIAGKYYLSMDCGISFTSSSATDGWQVTIQKNGSASEIFDMLFAGGENGYEDHIRCDAILKLAASDEIRWHMNGYGGSMSFVGMKFQGYLVG